MSGHISRIMYKIHDFLYMSAVTCKKSAIGKETLHTGAPGLISVLYIQPRYGNPTDMRSIGNTRQVNVKWRIT